MLIFSFIWAAPVYLFDEYRTLCIEIGFSQATTHLVAMYYVCSKFVRALLTKLFSGESYQRQNGTKITGKKVFFFLLRLQWKTCLFTPGPFLKRSLKSVLPMVFGQACKYVVCADVRISFVPLPSHYCLEYCLIEFGLKAQIKLAKRAPNEDSISNLLPS